jgi:hypothetical protein
MGGGSMRAALERCSYCLLRDRVEALLGMPGLIAAGDRHGLLEVTTRAMTARFPILARDPEQLRRGILAGQAKLFASG